MASCKCKTDCNHNRCNCKKRGKPCRISCGCNQDICQNRVWALFCTSCTTGCTHARCTCFSFHQKCSDRCRCKNCQNLEVAVEAIDDEIFEPQPGPSSKPDPVIIPPPLINPIPEFEPIPGPSSRPDPLPVFEPRPGTSSQPDHINQPAVLNLPPVINQLVEAVSDENDPNIIYLHRCFCAPTTLRPEFQDLHKCYINVVCHRSNPDKICPITRYIRLPAKRSKRFQVQYILRHRGNVFKFVNRSELIRHLRTRRVDYDLILNKINFNPSECVCCPHTSLRLFTPTPP